MIGYRLLFLLSLAVLAGCTQEQASADTQGQCTETPPCADAVATDSTLRLLPVGDSRVQGYTPDFESYRYALWQRFVQDKRSVDFMGTQTDTGCYLPVYSVCFDRDHEGTGGDRTLDVLDMLANTTFAHTPNVVLLGIGINDINGGVEPATALDNLNTIIEDLQALNDSLVIIVEQVPPNRSDRMTPTLTAALAAYNNGIPALADAQTTGSQRVVVVDMTADWRDDYMADVVHYNAAGAAVVANRYYQAIEAVFYE